MENNKAIAILKDKTSMNVDIPPYEIFHKDLGDVINRQVAANIIKSYEAPPAPNPPWWLSMLPSLVLVAMVVLFGYFLQQSQGGGGRGALLWQKQG